MTLHRSRALVLGALALAPSVATAGPAFDLAVRGSSCKQSPQGHLACRYVIGNDLEISITAAGEWDAGISFLRSNIRGDYFARFGVMHGCVIVAEGEVTARASAGPSDYAFISPKNGRVYRTWQECKASNQ